MNNHQIQELVRGCTGLTSIVIPDSVTKIGESVSEGCTGLKSVIIEGKLKKIPRFQEVCEFEIDIREFI